MCLFEMAPTRLRGVLNIGLQCFTTSGILEANLINYGTNKIQGGSVTPSTSVQPYVCMFFTCAIFFSFIMDLIFYSLCSLAGYFFMAQTKSRAVGEAGFLSPGIMEANEM